MMQTYLINFARLLANFLIVIIFVRVLLSWIPAGLGKFRAFVFDVTEPILKPIRKIVPPIGGTIDLSPIVVLLILQILLSMIGG